MLRSDGSIQKFYDLKYKFLILFFILCISCEDEVELREVTISGKVTDAVSGMPVNGARVSLCIHYLYEVKSYTIDISGSSCISDSSGIYTMKYKYNEDEPVHFKETSFPYRDMSFTFPDLFNVYATGTNYITSDYHSLSDNLLNEADIRMYHSAQLNIHVRNEGINHVDGVRVCVDKGPGFSVFGTPQYIFKCIGNDFDSIYVLKDLWGGFYYTCKVISLTGSTYNPLPYANKSSLLVPDTINYLFVAY